MNEKAPPAACAAGLLVECWPKLPYADRGPPRRVRFSSIVVVAIAQSWVGAIASIAEVGQMATYETGLSPARGPRMEALMVRRSSLRLTVFALFLVGGCDSAVIIDSDGFIEVAISTRGQDPDPDGYSLTVDGAQSYILPLSGALTLQLAEGNHTVELGGMAENCAVDGPNPRAIVVGASGAADVSFTVVCARATTGGFKVIVSTGGSPSDPDGYQLSVAGAESRFIASDATEVFLRLTPGVHLITLKDLADGCALDGGNPRPTTVLPGKTVEVQLHVSCGAGGPVG